MPRKSWFSFLSAFRTGKQNQALYAEVSDEVIKLATFIDSALDHTPWDFVGSAADEGEVEAIRLEFDPVLRLLGDIEEQLTVQAPQTFKDIGDLEPLVRGFHERLLFQIKANQRLKPTSEDDGRDTAERRLAERVRALLDTTEWSDERVDVEDLLRLTGQFADARDHLETLEAQETTAPEGLKHPSRPKLLKALKAAVPLLSSLKAELEELVKQNLVVEDPPPDLSTKQMSQTAAPIEKLGSPDKILERIQKIWDTYADTDWHYDAPSESEVTGAKQAFKERHYDALLKYKSEPTLGLQVSLLERGPELDKAEETLRALLDAHEEAESLDLAGDVLARIQKIWDTYEGTDWDLDGVSEDDVVRAKAHFHYVAYAKLLAFKSSPSRELQAELLGMGGALDKEEEALQALLRASAKKGDVKLKRRAVQLFAALYDTKWRYDKVEKETVQDLKRRFEPVRGIIRRPKGILGLAAPASFTADVTPHRALIDGLLKEVDALLVQTQPLGGSGVAKRLERIAEIWGLYTDTPWDLERVDEGKLMRAKWSFQEELYAPYVAYLRVRGREDERRLGRLDVDDAARTIQELLDENYRGGADGALWEEAERVSRVLHWTRWDFINVDEAEVAKLRERFKAVHEAVEAYKEKRESGLVGPAPLPISDHKALIQSVGKEANALHELSEREVEDPAASVLARIEGIKDGFSFTDWDYDHVSKEDLRRERDRFDDDIYDKLRAYNRQRTKPLQAELLGMDGALREFEALLQRFMEANLQVDSAEAWGEAIRFKASLDDAVWDFDKADEDIVSSIGERFGPARALLEAELKRRAAGRTTTTKEHLAILEQRPLLLKLTFELDVQLKLNAGTFVDPAAEVLARIQAIWDTYEGGPWDFARVPEEQVRGTQREFGGTVYVKLEAYQRQRTPERLAELLGMDKELKEAEATLQHLREANETFNPREVLHEAALIEAALNDTEWDPDKVDPKVIAALKWRYTSIKKKLDIHASKKKSFWQRGGNELLLGTFVPELKELARDVDAQVRLNQATD